MNDNHLIPSEAQRFSRISFEILQDTSGLEKIGQIGLRHQSYCLVECNGSRGDTIRLDLNVLSGFIYPWKRSVRLRGGHEASCIGRILDLYVSAASQMTYTCLPVIRICERQSLLRSIVRDLFIYKKKTNLMKSCLFFIAGSNSIVLFWS